MRFLLIIALGLIVLALPYQTSVATDCDSYTLCTDGTECPPSKIGRVPVTTTIYYDARNFGNCALGCKILPQVGIIFQVSGQGGGGECGFASNCSMFNPKCLNGRLVCGWQSSGYIDDGAGEYIGDCVGCQAGEWDRIFEFCGDCAFWTGGPGGYEVQCGCYFRMIDIDYNDPFYCIEIQPYPASCD